MSPRRRWGPGTPSLPQWARLLIFLVLGLALLMPAIDEVLDHVALRDVVPVRHVVWAEFLLLRTGALYVLLLALVLDRIRPRSVGSKDLRSLPLVLLLLVLRVLGLLALVLTSTRSVR